MAYTKQNFINGVALDATQLNAIEDGIVAAHNALEQKQPKGNYLTEVPDGYATEDFVKNKIAEAELSGGDVDLSGYATKDAIPTKTSQLTNDSGFLTEHQDLTDYAKKTDIPSIPIQSVNGKTGAVSIGASDVGADPSGTANSVMSAHNASPDSHADIRELISELSGQNANGAGLTAEEKSLLLSVVNNALYGADIGAVKARLNALWSGESGGGSGGDSGNTDPGALYTISTKFVNVTIDNSTTSVTANSAFNATLTPTTGELASITITMGGVDVTADVYASGVITIPAVTGNIVIEASASAYVNLIADAEWRAGTKEDWENGLTYNKNSGKDYTFPAGTYYFYALHKNAAGGTPNFYIPNGDGTYTIKDASSYAYEDNNGLFKDGNYNEYNKETSSYYQPADELYLIESKITFDQDVTARIVYASGWYIIEHPEYVWCFTQPYNPHKDVLGWEV